MAAVGIQKQSQLLIRDKAPVFEESVLIVAEHILRQDVYKRQVYDGLGQLPEFVE